MNLIRLISQVLIILVTTGVAAYCHEIVLTSGRIIKSPSVIEDKTTVTYEKYGGMITISRTDVEKIVYTKRAKETTKSSLKESLPSERFNLARQLEEAKQPKNPIERANMCSVYIETVAGSGSGFFISDDGLIVTNRHVVRGSSRQNRKVSEKMKDTDEKLFRLKSGLNREKDRIRKYEKRIKRKWQEYKKSRKIARTKREKQQLMDYHRDLLDHEIELKEWRLDYKKRTVEYGRYLNRYSLKKNEYYQIKEEQKGQFKFTITLADGTKKQAILYKISDSLDLALLKIKGYKTPYLLPAEKSKTALGDTVYAIGSPLNLTNSVTSGVLSSYRKDYIQTNAEIYPGNSGGPLITKEGKVLGVNTLKLVTEKFEGLGFAIHIDLVYREFKRFLQ